MATGNPRLFQGRDLDAESGLYYFRNRQYDPQHGRFLSRDPAGYHDSYCLYQFCNNNPVCYVDPMGLAERTVALAARGRDEGSWKGWATSTVGAANVEQFSSGEDVMDILKAWSAQGDDECKCIKRLYVFSHAWAYKSSEGSKHNGGFYGDDTTADKNGTGFYGKKASSDKADARYLDDLNSAIAKGEISFCEGSEILFAGCRIASTGTFAFQLAAITHSKITAATGESSGTEAPWWWSGPLTDEERNDAKQDPNYDDRGNKPFWEITPNFDDIGNFAGYTIDKKKPYRSFWGEDADTYKDDRFSR